MTTVAMITGAGRGMGLACAEVLAHRADLLVLADRDEAAAAAAAARLSATGTRAEAFAVDIAGAAGVRDLAAHLSTRGDLRWVAHAAGISSTMADWRAILTVDLIGTARLLEALRPLAGPGTTTAVFASMAPLLDPAPPDPAALAVLDDPLHEEFLDRLREVLGAAVEQPGIAYSWAKRDVRRLVWAEAVRLGAAGARICSISPGMIDTPQGRQEAREHASMRALVERTPLGREGRPEEIAAVVGFALSEAASFLNGTRPARRRRRGRGDASGYGRAAVTVSDDIATRIAQRALAQRSAAYADDVRRLLDAALVVMRRCGTGARPRVADIVAAAGLSIEWTAVPPLRTRCANGLPECCPRVWERSPPPRAR